MSVSGSSGPACDLTARSTASREPCSLGIVASPRWAFRALVPIVAELEGEIKENRTAPLRAIASGLLETAKPAGSIYRDRRRVTLSSFRRRICLTLMLSAYRRNDLPTAFEEAKL